MLLTKSTVYLSLTNLTSAFCVPSDIPWPEKNGKRHRITKALSTEGSFEVEDYSLPESPEVDISVVEDHGGPKLSRIN